MALDNIDQYKYDHLQELSNSDYEIVDGEPDIQGWTVKNELGQKIGEVVEMLFDPEARKVRYLIVNLQASELDIKFESRVLIPIGIAKLYSNDNRTDAEIRETSTFNPNPELSADSYEVDKETGVFTNNVVTTAIYDPTQDGDIVIVPATVEQLRQLPQYEKDNLTPATESTIRRVFEGDGVKEEPYARNDFYDHDHFDVDRFYDRGATTRSNLPVSEPSLDEPLTGGTVTPTHLNSQGFAGRELDEPKA
jgi:hypothetical protein